MEERDQLVFWRDRPIDVELGSFEYIANNFTDFYFSDFMITDYLELLKEVTYEDLIERFNDHFKEENLSLSIIRPL